jgi:hypothetical protein
MVQTLAQYLSGKLGTPVGKRRSMYEEVTARLRADGRRDTAAVIAAAGYDFEAAMQNLRLGIAVDEDFQISPVPTCSMDEISRYIKEHYTAHGFAYNGEDAEPDPVNGLFEDLTAGHLSSAFLRFAKGNTYLLINATLNRCSDSGSLKVTAKSKTVG